MQGHGSGAGSDLIYPSFHGKGRVAWTWPVLLIIQWCFGCWLYQGRGECSIPGGLLHPHQYCLPVPGRCLEYSVVVAAQLTSDLSLVCREVQTLKTTTGPSLTQADRFLLVFRVCFCLAPFEIGYDVGGKAPASEPRGVWSAAACRFLHRQSRKGRSQFSNFFNAYVCGSRS